MVKKLVPILIAAIASLIVVFITPSDSLGLQIKNASLQSEIGSSLLEQSVASYTDSPQEIVKIFDGDTLIGVITDQSRLNELLKEEYQTNYEADFPNTSLGFAEDVYTTTEVGYLVYENKDDDIFEYIQKNDLFAIATNKVVFSNGAVIYVKNQSDFEEAKESFLLNFISETSYNLFKKKQTTSELSTYGYRDVSLEVYETVEISAGFAPRKEILIDKNQIIYYLSYGVNPNISGSSTEKWYTVQNGDTVAGIAWQNNQITVDQLISTNSTVLFSQDQVLEPGIQLNVTEFSSPLNVLVTRERLYQETITPDAPQQIPDSSLDKGKTVIDVVEEVGYKNVKRLEVYLNGQLTDNTTIVSEVTTKPAVQGVIRYGTYVPPSTGTGSFIIPVSNANLTCNMYCYAGHRGVDWQNRYMRWGSPIYAGDTGTIEAAGWSGGFGYRVVINHNNGIKTLYAHMIQQPSVVAGQVVTRGQIIGYVGETGNAQGPHVHVEVTVNGVLRNPCDGFFPC